MIYKLGHDRERYLSFDISAYDIEYIIGDFFLLDEPLWTEFWQPMSATFFDNSEEKNVAAIPDISDWFGYNCLALNQKAYEKLQCHLEKYGELLPIQCEGISYWLFHSTVKTGMECVDLNKSVRTIDETGFVDMQVLEFREETLKGHLVFQTEFNNYRNMYCTKEFKKLVLENDLKGLHFSTDLACLTEF